MALLDPEHRHLPQLNRIAIYVARDLKTVEAVMAGDAKNIGHKFYFEADRAGALPIAQVNFVTRDFGLPEYASLISNSLGHSLAGARNG